VGVTTTLRFILMWFVFNASGGCSENKRNSA